MNYFAHGQAFLDEPYRLAGTAVPDWLNVIDRKMKARSREAQPFLADPDPRIAAVATGIVQHHHDDRWFHQTRAFAELSLQLTVVVRDALPPDDSFRPSFLGHILVEILLDATLIAADPSRLDAYYAALNELDPQLVGSVVNRIATRQSTLLSALIPRFCAERFLYDYLEDEKLLGRLNQVMRRVKLPKLPRTLLSILPDARQRVAARRQELLSGAEPNMNSEGDAP